MFPKTNKQTNKQITNKQTNKQINKQQDDDCDHIVCQNKNKVTLVNNGSRNNTLPYMLMQQD